MKKSLIFTIIFLFSGSALLHAQKFQVPSLDNAPNLFDVTLKETNDVEGSREAYMRGTTEAEPLKLSVNKLGFALFPVTVTVLGSGPDDEIQVAFVKQHWGDTISEHSTVDGVFQTEFKAEREFGIVIHSDQPGTEFAVAIWIGPEIKPQADNVFISAARFKDSGGNGTSAEQNGESAESTSSDGSNTLLYTIIGLLAVLIIVGLLIFLKMNKKVSIVIILLCSSYSLAHAGVTPTTEEMYETFKEAANLTEGLRELRDKVEALQADYEMFKNLSEAEEDFETQLDKRSQPQIPSSCIIAWESRKPKHQRTTEDDAKEEACDCLEKAYQEFYDVRYNLLKLSNIYTSTKKVSDWAISFGDSWAPSTREGAIAWRRERDKIEESTEELGKAYDRKYEQYIETLYEVMMEIDQCEAQMGFENWYGRAGFMFFEFTKERYLRNEM